MSVVDGKSPQVAARVAYVQSCWHRDIVDRARHGFTTRLAEAGGADLQIDFFEVPGAFELPLMAKRLAASRDYAAVVAAGLVVNGGIYSHQFVADAVIQGLMRVQLENEVPVLSLVLTPLNFHEHEVHEQFFSEHFDVKGGEAADACLATLAAHRALPARDSGEAKGD